MYTLKLEPEYVNIDNFMKLGWQKKVKMKTEFS